MKVFQSIENQVFVYKNRGPAEAAERHPPSDPSENLTKEVLVPSDCTTRKPYCHAELDSASIQRWKLPVSLDRFRNRLARLAKNGTAKSVVFALCLRSLAQFGMTLKEILSLRAVADRVAIQVPEAHPREVEHDFLTPNQLGTGLTAGGLPRSRWSLAMTRCVAFTMAERCVKRD